MDCDDGDDDDKSELQVVKVHFNSTNRAKKNEAAHTNLPKDNWIRMNEKMEFDMHGISRVRF